ncbi:hypothetical protein [Microbacterium trichothecenolyticum]|uniref:PucR C-terminal helix-turn-helix domain-containing protein n=1 Tax=Microbacterium trichothecenolyticum TaxID=69370 RepID=A0A0M2H7C1_MICTR|nr:hypothetical protein [Microbacterium trichothecenolyticum]KJL42285.1 hypothetical protein RS82_02301 [Microbacterium trichothecenolyticum]
MQDLLGRLTALDPDASETLKVVSYFDALITRLVGAESMLRGAALLAGATVGYRDGSHLTRLSAEGRRLPPAAPDGWPRHQAGTDAEVWLERQGNQHANDAMILERLALALGIIRARRTIGAESAVELVISSYTEPDERVAALARLRIEPGTLRVIASPPDPAPEPSHPSAVVTTRYGLTRATIVDSIIDPQAAWSEPPRLGIGLAVLSDRLPASWSSALIAARLSTPAEPMLDAADLGAALAIAESAETAPLHPDAAALMRLDPSSLELLDVLSAERSVRGAAIRLGRHHSSVQERVGTLACQIGYDPRSARGHTRYAIARMLMTVAPQPAPSPARVRDNELDDLSGHTPTNP